MEREDTNGKMAAFTKASLKEDIEMVKAYYNKLMAPFTKVIILLRK